MDKLERVQRSRAKITKEIWDTTVGDNRDMLLLDLLDEDSEVFNDDFLYGLFWRVYDEEIGEGWGNMTFDYSRLMELFDLCERYARNWVFA